MRLGHVRHIDAWAVYAVTPGHDGKGDLHVPCVVAGVVAGGVAPIQHVPVATRARARAAAAKLNDLWSGAGWTWRVARVRIITVWRA
jgi:hypothetical protein